jgi:ABC-type siderophore export system fused ATPase/permease subunit
MAGMDPKTIFWYSHEEKYFEVAKDMIMAEFDRFFTEI